MRILSRACPALDAGKDALLIAVLLSWATASAQQLVPNGGLEQFSTCPDAMGQVDRAIGWAQPTLGSTDYFNACQGAPYTMSVPANLMGHQPAQRAPPRRHQDRAPMNM